MKQRTFISVLVMLVLTCLITACSANVSTSTDTSEADVQSLYGDWHYSGEVDNSTYEVNLDLEKSNFTLEMEREGVDTTADSEIRGTYRVEGDTLVLSVDSVSDNNGYFTENVKADSTIELEYSINEGDFLTFLTLKNISGTINSFPDELELYRED